MKVSQSNKLNRAKRFCETNKYRFTEPRERVLSLLLSRHEPLGAYQILKLLSSKQAKIKPPTVYRAIDFWKKNGFIHRIESMNAYIACCEHKHHQNFCIFICNQCNKVSELTLETLSQSITNIIKDKSIVITRSTTELFGSCFECNR